METLAIGGQLSVDAADVTTLAFSWSGHFEEGVELADAGTFTVADETAPTADPVTLTASAGILDETGISVLFQISGGTRGHIYQVSHHVTTVEVAPQQRTRSFYVYVKEL